MTDQVALVVKKVPINAGSTSKGVRSLGQEDFLEKETATHSSILPWKIHGQRSLAGYSVWVRKESDMTEPLNSVLTALKIHFRVYCKKSRTGGSEVFPLPSHNHPILIPATKWEYSLQDPRQQEN